MSIVQRHFVEPPETRMVLENVAWETYVALADQRRGSIPRMFYDNGVLEMMSPKREHQNIGRLIGRMIETYSELRDIEIISVASVTVNRSDLSKAYEADESYYVTHAAELLGRRELDSAKPSAGREIPPLPIDRNSTDRVRTVAVEMRMPAHVLANVATSGRLAYFAGIH